MLPGSRRASYVAFGREDGRTLYVDKVWKRKTKLIGAPSLKRPVKPSKPRS
ncbi:MAG: hypothetical protein ACI9UA_006079 [Pseudoalteromonas tetraodonis]|jgi:hypothetical protein